MKTLVVFYSLDGNTKIIAESIASTVEADILELKPKSESSAKGFMKYIWAGRSAIMKEKPELVSLEKSPRDYDLLFIGTPVWAWNYAPPLNTFLMQSDFEGKKIALFCCHGGGKGNIFGKLKAALINNEVVAQIDFQDPLRRKKEQSVQKAKEWAKGIIARF